MKRTATIFLSFLCGLSAEAAENYFADAPPLRSADLQFALPNNVTMFRQMQVTGKNSIAAIDIYSTGSTGKNTDNLRGIGTFVSREVRSLRSDSLPIQKSGIFGGKASGRYDKIVFQTTFVCKFSGYKNISSIFTEEIKPAREYSCTKDTVYSDPDANTTNESTIVFVESLGMFVETDSQPTRLTAARQLVSARYR